jgi:hypothetical protein
LGFLASSLAKKNDVKNIGSSYTFGENEQGVPGYWFRIVFNQLISADREPSEKQLTEEKITLKDEVL